MPQMSLIYWLIMMLYFIFMLTISITMICFFYLPSTNSLLMTKK